MIARLFTWFAPILTFTGFELLFLQPQNLFWIAPFLALFVFLTVWQISGRSFKPYFWRYLISPLLLVIGAFLFMSILEGIFVKHIIAFLLSLFLAVFLENMYVYWHKQSKFQNYSMLNISSYTNVVIVFLFSASLYWFLVFLSFPLSLASSIIAVVLLLLTYQLFAIGELRAKRRWLYVVVLPLIGLEFFISESYLPTSVYINASLLTMVYYVMSGIGKNQLLNMLNLRTVMRYMGIFFVCLALILVTAKYV